jgi:hypothetical protein
MRTTALLTLANLGTAFAAVQVYGQCGGSAYTGDTECPSGSSCVEASKWYSQCIPSSKGVSTSTKAASVEKSDFEFPNFGFPAAPELPAAGDSNQGNGGAVFPPVFPSPEDDSSEEPVGTPVDAPVTGPTDTPNSEPVADVPATTPTAGSGSGSGGIQRTIPASSGATAVATAIPVSGELDGGMTYYDRSRKSLNLILTNLANTFQPPCARIRKRLERLMLCSSSKTVPLSATSLSALARLRVSTARALALSRMSGSRTSVRTLSL